MLNDSISFVTVSHNRTLQARSEFLRCPRLQCQLARGHPSVCPLLNVKDPSHIMCQRVGWVDRLVSARQSPAVGAFRRPSLDLSPRLNGIRV